MKIEDLIKQQIRSELSDFEAPLPQDGWSRIEESLVAIETKAKIARLWRWGSAAAAVVALFVAGWIFTQQPKPTINQIADNDNPPSQILPETEPSITTTPSSPQIIAKAEIPRSITAQSPSEPFSTEVEYSVPIDDPQPESLPAIDSTHPDEAEKERLTEEFAKMGNADIFNEEAIAHKKGKQSKTVLSVGGKGGMSPYQSEVNSLITLRSAKNDDKKSEDGPTLLNALEKKPMDIANNPVYSSGVSDNVAEMKHSRPISFGITASRNLSEKVAVETGLVYTYLHSKAGNTANEFQNSESQEFHYLGIPLNVNYNFFNWERLSMHLSVGGMIEKDVFGEYKYYDQTKVDELETPTTEREISTRIYQKHPQFSVNGSVGISYPIAGSLSLYGKAGVAYYFNAKNEYKTIYSDKIIVPDFQVGFRIEL